MSYHLDRDIAIETFILTTNSVDDIDDYIANRSRYLISIANDADGAAKEWRRQSRSITPGEGAISIKVSGVELIPVEFWCDTQGFWFSALDCVQDYFRFGCAKVLLPDQSLELSITKNKGYSLLNVAGVKVLVSQKKLIDSILCAALNYFEWQYHYVGDVDESMINQIKSIMDKLNK